MRAKILLILAPMLCLLCSTAAVAENQPDPIRIGVITCLSGEFAEWGNNFRQGIELARTELPTEIKQRFEVIFEDDAFQGPKTISALHKLSSVNQIAALLVTGSAAGNAVAPLVERNHLVTIAVGASDKKIVDGRKYVFTHWVAPEKEGQEMAAEIRRRGYKRVALLVNEHEGLRAIATAFKAQLKQDGSVSVSYENYFGPDISDFKSMIPTIKASASDGVALLLFPTRIGLFSRQAHSLGYSGQFFGSETFDDKAVIQPYRATLSGSWYSSAAGGTDEFVEKFKAHFGHAPGFGAANSYDAFKLLAQAFGALGFSHDQPDELAQYLHSVKNFSGAFGSYSATGDNRFDLPAVINTVQ